MTADLRDKDADIEKIEDWLGKKLIAGLEKEYFGEAGPEYDDLMAIFFREYKRWVNAEYKYLYETDKNQFKIQFGAYMYGLRDNNINLYLERLLQNASSLRQLMPCIIFDNVDHYDSAFQNRVFQYAQSVYRSALSFVIMPITDRTIWQLSKNGPLQSFDTTTYYLPVPSIKSILSRRLEFIKKKLAMQKGEAAEYFSAHGIRFHIRDFNAFISSVERVLLDTDYIAKLINSLANYDIRRCLVLVGKLIASPWLNIDGLIKTYLLQQAINIEEWRIRKALIAGDYQHYKAANSEFIENLFTVNPKSYTTPLLGVSILRFFRDRDEAETNIERKYASVEDAYKYFDVMGIPRLAFMEKIRDLVNYRLLEPYDPTRDDVELDQLLRITASGRTHYFFAMRGPIYSEEMALTTPVADAGLGYDLREISLKIATNAYPGGRHAGRREIERKFKEYCLDEDRLTVSIPHGVQYEGQYNLRHRFKMGIPRKPDELLSDRREKTIFSLKDEAV